MKKLGYKRDLKEIEYIADEVVSVILEVLTILDEEYGDERDVDSDFGGYILILESVDDLGKLSEIYLDVETLIPEYCDVINSSNGDYTNSLILINSEYSITLIMPYGITPNSLSKYIEHFIVAYLDTKNQPTAIHTVSVGSLNSSIVHPREVYKGALQSNASSILISHNHPSGDVKPSYEDIEVTKRLVEVGKLIGIKVTDHIIVGDDCYYSFKEENMI